MAMVMGIQPKGRAPKVKVMGHTGVETQMEHVTHQRMGVGETQVVMRGQVKVRNPQTEGEVLLREMVIQEEEVMIQTLVMTRMGMIHPLQQVPLPIRKKNIEAPNMFMCYRDLQDHQVRKASLVKLEEMVEMVKICL